MLCKKHPLKEGDVPPHLAIWYDAYIDDTDNTMKDDKYPWLDKHDKRLSMSDREIIEWKVNLKDSKLTKD